MAIKTLLGGVGLSLGTLLFRFGSPVGNTIVSGIRFRRSAGLEFSRPLQVHDLGHTDVV